MWEITTKARIGKLPGALEAAADVPSCVATQLTPQHDAAPDIRGAGDALQVRRLDRSAVRPLELLVGEHLVDEGACFCAGSDRSPSSSQRLCP